MTENPSFFILLLTIINIDFKKTKDRIFRV